MSTLYEINKLFMASYELYEESATARHALHNEEWNLHINALGELEIIRDSVAGVEYSICNGRFPINHINSLVKISLKKLTNYEMVKNYPTILKYVENWEQIRLLCIEYLKNNITNKVRLCSHSEPQSEPFVGQARSYI